MMNWRALLAIVVVANVHFATPSVVAAQSTEAIRIRAEHGDADAQLSMGIAHALGLDVPKDNAQSRSWLLRSADQGNGSAMAMLGTGHYTGEAGAQDYVEAHKWFGLAAEYAYQKELTSESLTRIERAKYVRLRRELADTRDSVANRLTPAQVIDAQARALAWRTGFYRRRSESLVSMSVSAPAVPNFIHPSHAIPLKQWLATQPGFRVATADDCGAPRQERCSRISSLRKSDPNYQPYYSVGDYNDDRVDDFAVVVINPRNLIGDPAVPDFSAVLAVFDGPFEQSEARPAFTEGNLYLLESALFSGPPRPKPYRLGIGGFESEGWILEPQPTGYRCVYRACQGR